MVMIIAQWTTPVNTKEVRAFLGIIGYYRKFIEHYGIIIKPLTNPLRKGAIFLHVLPSKLLGKP